MKGFAYCETLEEKPGRKARVILEGRATRFFFFSCSIANLLSEDSFVPNLVLGLSISCLEVNRLCDPIAFFCVVSESKSV